jgi:Response regulator containing a CheY-like receiver domain and an HTH DNA-binding domain
VIADALSRVAGGERIFTRPRCEEPSPSSAAERGRRVRRPAHNRTCRRERSGSSSTRLAASRSARSRGASVLSPRTVETHLGNAYRKLGVSNRVQALARASGLGLIRIG